MRQARVKNGNAKSSKVIDEGPESEAQFLFFTKFRLKSDRDVSN